MELVKKLGRKKKQILETSDREALEAFQRILRRNLKSIGVKNLTDKEKDFVKKFFILKIDDQFTRTVKSLRYKHYIMKKPLTQDECTYFVDVDKHGTKPTAEKRLSKMTICKIEAAVLPKLREQIEQKMGAHCMGDILCSDEEKFRVPGKYRNEDEE